MKICFFDLETTDKNPVGAEILTGFFKVIENERIIDSYDLKIKPDLFKEEAFAIHGISKREAESFPSREFALRELYQFLKKHSDSYFCCHANATLFGRSGHYDWTVLGTNFAFLSDSAYFHFNSLKIKVISTHTMAKKLVKIDGYSLENLARYFNYEYQAHDAKNDVEAMIHVFEQLTAKLPPEYDLYDLGHYSGVKNWEQYRTDQNYLPLEF
jgi:DNA polymerase III epsilon subunit-like protein